MKLFYSYSHKNEMYRDDMEKHLALLKQQGKLDDWSDKKIVAGENINNDINANFNDSNIICLLVSSDFIASTACMGELELALKRRDKDGISIIPIILSPCAWKDTELRDIKALPKDGRPISAFQDKEEAWFSVYEDIKIVIQKVTSPIINKDHKKFLEDTELSSILNRNITLSDIFVPLDLKKREYSEKQCNINFKDFLKEYFESPENIIISGDQQSGKSVLLKRISAQIYPKYIPIYIDCSQNVSGKIINLINKYFKKQYCSSEDIIYFNAKKVILFDDFHKLKTAERKKIIEFIKDTQDIKMIVTVDDIYNLGIKEQMLTKIFKHYNIKNMGQKLRDELICKWMEINGRNCELETIYRDEMTSRINMVLQKTIVPSHPFFIYTIIATHEDINPLNQEITSQGHCYQALIYFALKKIGATDVQIDMYINLLSELASFLYKERDDVLSEDKLNDFFVQYCEQFPLSIKKELLIKNLINTSILNCSSVKEYSFKYKYIYFFFLGKHFSVHIDESEDSIKEIIDNLQKEENGYILIFLIHHTKNAEILKHIELNLLRLFTKQKETTLIDGEVEHLKKYAEALEPLVIDKVINVEKNRKESLEQKDKEEDKEDLQESDREDCLMADLRRAIKTVEVAGHILKNRSGSLKTAEQKKFLGAAMDVFLRITDRFLSEFQKNEQDFVEYISYLVSKKLMGKRGEPLEDESKIRHVAAKIFFNMNLITCFATVRRVSDSICSKELLNILEEVCNEKSTPISYLIKKQCKMIYKGAIDIKDIDNNFKSMSFFTQRLLINLVLDHCYMHKIDYKDRQKISNILEIKERAIPIG